MLLHSLHSSAFVCEPVHECLTTYGEWCSVHRANQIPIHVKEEKGVFFARRKVHTFLLAAHLHLTDGVNCSEAFKMPNRTNTANSVNGIRWAHVEQRSPPSPPMAVAINLWSTAVRSMNTFKLAQLFDAFVWNAAKRAFQIVLLALLRAIWKIRFSLHQINFVLFHWFPRVLKQNEKNVHVIVANEQYA